MSSGPLDAEAASKAGHEADLNMGDQLSANVHDGANAQSEEAEAPEPQTQPTANLSSSSNNHATDEPPLSKNAAKRLRRQQEWDEGKEDRRKRRKQKRHDIKVRQRDRRAALLAAGTDPAIVYPKKNAGTLVPVTLVLDCDFEQYMMEKELISLSSQLTRSYSDNKYAKYKTHLWFAGWKGKIKQRFTDVLFDQQKNWQGVGYCEGDFVEGAEKARETMELEGGEMIGALQRSLDEKATWTRDDTDPQPMAEPEPEPKEEYKDIVYLTSDSPYTLERLEPNTSYIIGGLVDKNREKGLCYRRARERGVRTAKLPIGQFLVMASRPALATNHVVEIMLKWLEYEDWAQAFLSVIPKRKGGKLRGEGSKSDLGQHDEGDKDDDEDGAEYPEESTAVVQDEAVTEEAPVRS